MTIGDSNAARASILARIRKAQGRGASRPSEAELETLRTYLKAHPRGPLPPAPADLVARFRDMAESTQSTTEELARDSEVPQAVARYLRANDLPLSGCVWPLLARLDWAGAGLDLSPRSALAEDRVGVTGAFAGLAETGTLMLISGPATPASVSLLPETHIAVLPSRRIVAFMEEAWDLARQTYGELPRSVNFISGPSRTADIEQKMVLGVHGPYRVHIIIVRED